MIDENRPGSDDDNCSVSFEEFLLYYQTTEKVTEQRQALNRWNYSVCIALIVAIAVLIKFASDKASYIFVGALGAVTLCVVALFFCRHWLAQIEDFKKLNYAKFKILNEMAPRIKFNDLPEAVSYQPFDREWKEVEAVKAATAIKQLQGQVALSSSTAELFIPKVFIRIFVCTAVLVVAITITAITVPGTRQFLPVAPPSATPTPTKPASTTPIPASPTTRGGPSPTTAKQP